MKTTVRSKPLSSACLSAGLISLALSAPSALAADPQSAWLDRLDAWVVSGGSIATVQNDVVVNCGKLTVEDVGLVDSARILATKEGREDFDLRVDVCTKLTINRVYPQPDFEKPAVRRIVCGDLAAAHPAIAKLCERAKVRPSG